MNKPLIIDIYSGDAVVDFSLTVGSGIIGCIHKATEGLGFVDKRYESRRKMWADAKGEMWGAYCFFHGRDKGGDPIKEADYFLSAAQPDGNTLLSLDWETDEDGYKPSADEARAFVERVIERASRTAIWIYSGNIAKEKLSGANIFFGKQHLWLAQYASHWGVQASWPEPDLWQNNGDNLGPGPHTIPGMSGYCDNSTIVSGTVDDLRAKWAGTPASDHDPVYPPPVEQDRAVMFIAHGKMSTFGGPKDTGVMSTEGLALYSSAQQMADSLGGDWVFTAAQANAYGLARRINPDKPYLACRWPTGKYDFLRSAVVHVSAKGKNVEARAVDWGPNVNTGRAADLSPGLAKALGLDTGDICTVTVYEDGK